MKRGHTFENPLPKKRKCLAFYLNTSDVSDMSDISETSESSEKSSEESSEESSSESESGWNDNLFTSSRKDTDIKMESEEEQDCEMHNSHSVRESTLLFFFMHGSQNVSISYSMQTRLLHMVNKCT